jgi:membrane protease YdiL (CAAX protease family)
MIEKPAYTGNIVRLAVVFEGGILLAAVILGWLFGRPTIQQLNWSMKAALQGTVATVPLLIGMWACSKTSFGPIANLMHQVENQIVPLFNGASAKELLLVSTLAGLGEECLFRGVLQPEVASWVGVPVALVLTSALFGLAHFITPTYAVFAGMIGAYVGALAVLTGNLLVPVATHALYDFAALMYLTRRHASASR